MKRFFLYAMMAAGVLASCSQSENEGSTGESTDGIDVDMASPINLAVTAPSVKVNVTRSGGTIGVDDSGRITNKWSGQTLYVYGCQRKDGKVDLDGTYALSGLNMQGEKCVVSQAESVSTVAWERGTRYFPRSGVYDFYGYYADDALTNQMAVENRNGLKVLAGTVEINGSQDLMLAKAVPSTEPVPDAVKEKVFSANAARAGVQPKLKFEHLLTRFVFKIQGVGTDRPENVYVQSVKVESKTTGKLVVVAANDEGRNVFFEDTKKDLYLQERDGKGGMKTLDPQKYYASETGEDPVTVGEALLVAPDDSYVVTVMLKQDVDKDGNPVPEDQQIQPYTTTLKPENVTGGSAALKTFAPSTSYNVTIVTNGVKIIELTAELGKWLDGGNIEINPDEE